MIDSSRAICGIATVFGQRAYDGTYWRRDMFEPWLSWSRRFR
jgi:hypothetical protein